MEEDRLPPLELRSKVYTETITAEQKAWVSLIPNLQPPTQSLKGKKELKICLIISLNLRVAIN